MKEHHLRDTLQALSLRRSLPHSLVALPLPTFSTSPPVEPTTATAPGSITDIATTVFNLLTTPTERISLSSPASYQSRTHIMARPLNQRKNSPQHTLNRQKPPRKPLLQADHSSSPYSSATPAETSTSINHHQTPLTSPSTATKNQSPPSLLG